MPFKGIRQHVSQHAQTADQREIISEWYQNLICSEYTTYEGEIYLFCIYTSRCLENNNCVCINLHRHHKIMMQLNKKWRKNHKTRLIILMSWSACQNSEDSAQILPTRTWIKPKYNYANPIYCFATICHQVPWLRWGNSSLFHTATSLLIWYKIFCVRDISHRLIWMEFINMFSVYAQSGTHSRFNW